jgi:uncharacterized repeat protein (TIGR01451 family)
MRKGIIVLTTLLLALGAAAGGLAAAGSAMRGSQRPVVRGAPNALATVAAADPCAEFPKTLVSGAGNTAFSTDGGASFPNIAFAVSPNPAWNVIDGTSWISLTRDGSSPSASSTTSYRRSFNVSQYTLDNAVLTLTGSVLADNSAKVSFNGQTLAQQPSGSPTSNFKTPTPFNYQGSPGKTNFQLSDNLDFTVTDQGEATGVDYSASVSCQPVSTGGGLLPDLTIDKFPTSPTPWQVSSTATYTFQTVVSNLGPGTVPAGAVVSAADNLPAGLTYVTASGTGWMCTASGPSCSTVPLLAGLPPMTSLPVITWTVKVTPLTPEPGKRTNCADTSSAGRR